MAQRDKEETEVQVTETLTLCANNCGFYANPATNNLCQSCFQAQIRNPASGSGHKKPRSDPISVPEADSSAAAAAAAAEDRSEAKEAAAAPRSANRCSCCRKRVGLTGFRCRCGELFCGTHRYSDRHVCSYDYKAAGREEIRRENPLVRAAKIVRI